VEARADGSDGNFEQGGGIAVVVAEPAADDEHLALRQWEVGDQVEEIDAVVGM
jgi:hypothetical protein